jgi:hypothetical protein
VGGLFAADVIALIQRRDQAMLLKNWKAADEGTEELVKKRNRNPRGPGVVWKRAKDVLKQDE